MKHRHIVGLLLAGTLFVLASCNVSKHIPTGDKLYGGAIVKVDSAMLSSEIKEEIAALPRPKPNTNVLGVRYKLMFYDAVPDSTKKKGFFKRIFKNMTEPPVLFSKANPAFTVTRIRKRLFDFGYYHPNIRFDTVIKKEVAYWQYNVNPGLRYTIRSIALPEDSSEVTTIIREIANKSLLRVGDFLETETLNKERTRIDDTLKNRGYYFYFPEQILFQVDTLHQGQADIVIRYRDDVPPRSMQQWKVGDISIYGNYSIQKDSIIQSQSGTRIKKFTIIDQTNKYNYGVYDRAILLEEGQIYQRQLHALSIERLMNLNTFKFVKFQFFPDSSKANQLHTKVYITPMKKNTLRLETSVNTKTGNFVGSEIGIKWRNVNLLKGAEILDFKISAGFDAQLGGKQVQSPNAYTFKTDLTFYLPRIIPYFKVVTGRNSFIPRTGITFGSEYLQRPDLYTLRSLKASLDYTWKYRNTTEHTLRPIRIQSINPTNITPKFDSILDQDLALRASFEKQLIIGSQYIFQYNNTFMEKRLTYWGRFSIGSYGNLISAVSGNKADTPGSVKFLNVPVSQFVRIELEGRVYYQLTNRWTWVNRLILGSAIAYGNSLIAPYNELFFIGGSSSVRAFRIRTLGPGSYHTEQSAFQANESGDIKIEANSEFRYNLSSKVKPAFFVDAGNIWFRREPPDKPGSKFTSAFMKQMAVGAGLGLRLDFSVMLLRFDFSIPLRKPWFPEGDRWVLDEIDLGNKAWRKDNLILSVAIGYPF
jgi:outer membrane protein insertion porin family